MKGGDHTEKYLVIKIKRPLPSEQEAFDRTMNYERFDAGKEHGHKRTGPEFIGEITIAAVGNAYAAELALRILRAACIPYSVHDGKPVKRRKRECGTSTASTLTMVELTAELARTQPSDLPNTTPESAEQQPANAGDMPSS